MRIHPKRVLQLAYVFSVLLCLCLIYDMLWPQSRPQLKKQQHQNVLHKGKPGDIMWGKDSGLFRKSAVIRSLGTRNETLESNNKSQNHPGRRKSDNLKKKVMNFSDLLNTELSQNEETSEEDAEDDQRKFQFNLNIYLSDQIPLNRDVPDSRPSGCASLKYPKKLPTISIVIPVYNEWPSVLLRTVYSLLTRTPRHLLKQIILVDDASELKILKNRLSNFITWNLPGNVVKIVRLPKREGLIRARLEGLKHVTGQTVSFLDSHMEVNEGWLEPLLNEIVKNRKTVAMAQLDYIDSNDFKYNFYQGYRTRYGFKWDMEFFETYFRPDQLVNKLDTDPLPGVLMVGPGFVVDTNYFKELGTYDKDMDIWGGENIEFAWRAWMCGGQLLHVPCSRIGHIERPQPYSFPNGRHKTELHNYKRAAEVWMGDYKEYVYEAMPGIKDMPAGNLTERILNRKRLQCKDFSWFLQNIWPELLPFRHTGKIWGQVKAFHGNVCLDTKGYLFLHGQPLELASCGNDMQTQVMAIDKDGLLHTNLHCVVAKEEGDDLIAFIQSCFLNIGEKWTYNEEKQLIHEDSKLCLQVMSGGKLVLEMCDKGLKTQQWVFRKLDGK